MWIKNQIGDLINIGRCEGILMEEFQNGGNTEFVIRAFCSGGDRYLISSQAETPEAEKIIERIAKAIKSGESLLDLEEYGM